MSAVAVQRQLPCRFQDGRVDVVAAAVNGGEHSLAVTLDGRRSRAGFGCVSVLSYSRLDFLSAKKPAAGHTPGKPPGTQWERINIERGLGMLRMNASQSAWLGRCRNDGAAAGRGGVDGVPLSIASARLSNNRIGRCRRANHVHGADARDTGHNLVVTLTPGRPRRVVGHAQLVGAKFSALSEFVRPSGARDCNEGRRTEPHPRLAGHP